MVWCIHPPLKKPLDGQQKSIVLLFPIYLSPVKNCPSPLHSTLNGGVDASRKANGQPPPFSSFFPRKFCWQMVPAVIGNPFGRSCSMAVSAQIKNRPKHVPFETGIDLYTTRPRGCDHDFGSISGKGNLPDIQRSSGSGQRTHLVCRRQERWAHLFPEPGGSQIHTVLGLSLDTVTEKLWMTF